MNIAYSSSPSSHNVILSQGTTTIGRARNNTIVLPHTSVNFYHAIIITLNKKAYIHDLRSIGGIYVNGEQVRYQILYQGDNVEIGEYNFTIAGFE